LAGDGGELGSRDNDAAGFCACDGVWAKHFAKRLALQQCKVAEQINALVPGPCIFAEQPRSVTLESPQDLLKACEIRVSARLISRLEY